jgi:hypothetical protein
MFLINGGEYWQAKEVKNKGNQRGEHRETEGQNRGKGAWLCTTEYIGVEMK